MSVYTRLYKHLHFEDIYTVYADTRTVTIHGANKCKTNSSIDVKKETAPCLCIWFRVRAALCFRIPHTHILKMTSAGEMAKFAVASYVNRMFVGLC
jgi:hypothetical protein